MTSPSPSRRSWRDAARGSSDGPSLSQSARNPRKAGGRAPSARLNWLRGKLALPNKRYGVIYADPPWRFEVYSEDTGQGRAAEAHYPTMSPEAIVALDVPSIAAEDCVLFMWTTSPTMPEAFGLLKEWGFAYRSQCIWAKDKIGLGFWFRNQHEILIVAIKGKVPAPAHGAQWPSLIQAARGKHSEKPAVFYELIEAYFPTLPKIELFARGKARPGWDAWGNEVEPR